VPLTKAWAESVTKAGGDPVSIEAALNAQLAKYGAGF
jgi:hypothetical protein